MDFEKISSIGITGSVSIKHKDNLCKMSLGFTNKGPIHSQKESNLLLPTLIFTSMLVYNQSFTEACLLVGTVSQVSGVAHGPQILIY